MEQFEKDTLESLNAVILYLERDERKHWEEEGKPADHVYTHVLQLKEFIKRVNE